MIEGRISPLELFHPGGVARSVAVIGSNCPIRLHPHARATTNGPIDLIILAPTVAECRTHRWLIDGTRTIADQLGPDGIVYALIPRHWRSRVARLLRDQGLVLGPAFAHLPGQPTSRYLLPLDLPAGGSAVLQNIAIRPASHHLLALALSFRRGDELLRRLLPGVGLIAHRPGTQPCDWVQTLGVGDRGSFVSIETGWREVSETAVVHCVGAPNGASAVVVKVGLTPAATADRAREARQLHLMAASARAAGANVPAGAMVRLGDGREALVQTEVPGRVVARLLGSRQISVPDAVQRVGSWLIAWNRATRAPAVLHHDDLVEKILVPARTVAVSTGAGAEYLDRLAELCRGVDGLVAPHVATHNDLTMANVFFADDGGVGVVDWEAASSAGLPLVDFFYAAADAVAAAERYRDRLGGFVACFDPSSRHFAMVADLYRRFCRDLEISSSVAELSFHLCWLQHALNEYRREQSAAVLPFQQIVGWIAGHSGEVESMLAT